VSPTWDERKRPSFVGEAIVAADWLVGGHNRVLRKRGNGKGSDESDSADQT